MNLNKSQINALCNKITKEIQEEEREKQIEIEKSGKLEEATINYSLYKKLETIFKDEDISSITISNKSFGKNNYKAILRNQVLNEVFGFKYLNPNLIQDAIVLYSIDSVDVGQLINLIKKEFSNKVVK